MFSCSFSNQVAESEEYRSGEEGDECELDQASSQALSFEDLRFEIDECGHEKEGEYKEPYEEAGQESP